MLTFSDLIKSGIAPAPYKTNIVTNDFESLDRFVINYNNIWGMISDTHMSKGEDGNYYITGQLFRDKEKTTNFLYAWNWGGYQFKNSSVGISSLYDYLRRNYKTVSHEIVNGDDVLVVRDFTKEQREYYDKYYGVNAQIGNQVCADYKKIEKDATKNADVERSLHFVY